MFQQIVISIGCCLFFCNVLQAELLKEPSKWFSIPVVGITEIDATAEGVDAKYKGTIAYKNKIKFERLEFNFSCQSGNSGSIALFQFNKERRDSSFNDHHLDRMDKYNRGYGLMFSADGKISIVKTEKFNDSKILLTLNNKCDFASPVHICVTQKTNAGQIEFGVELNHSGKIEHISDKLSNGFSGAGFIGLTIFHGPDSVKIKNISFAGQEDKTDLGQNPKPLYLADFFEKENSRLVHWRYDNWTTDFHKVIIKSPDGAILAALPYPKDYWVVDDNCKNDSVLLYVVNIDGHTSEPVKVLLKDDHTDYYSNKPQQRVAIKKDEKIATFYLNPSGERFVVKGMNYVRLRYGDHATFEADTKAGPGFYDPYDAETLFKLLKKNNYNTVRVFVVGRNIENPGISGDFENEGLYKPYMDNFIDFVKRAKKYGIYVFPTFCDGELPRNKRYWEIIKTAKADLQLDDVTHNAHNAIYATVEGQKARVQYVKDFLNYIKSEDASLLESFLAVQCQNELSMQGLQWPFDIVSGTFVGPDGKQYDMSDNGQRQKLYENIFNSYHTQIVKAVKSIDSELLVSEGIFTPRIVGKDYINKNYGVRNFDKLDDRCPPKAVTLLKSPLDFVDIHIYYVNKQTSLAESYKLDMVSTGLYEPQMKELLKKKAFIMGEFGSFKFMDSTFEKAKNSILQTRQLALSDNAGGFMMWTFDTFEQRNIWHMMEDEAFLKKLAKY